MNILITGGSGFIGSNLAEFHINRVDNIVVIDDLSTGSADNITHLLNHDRFTFIEDDVLTWDRLQAETAKAERIYHLAAVVGMFRVINEPTTVIRVNVCATERLLQAAADCNSKAQIFITSSSSVYGHNNDIRELRDQCEEAAS